MMTHAEHEQGPAVVRVIELVGVSAESWEDAARRVVERASRTLRHITGLDLIRGTGVVRDGRIAEYHATVKVAFIVEKAGASTEGQEGAASQARAHPSDELGIWGAASDLE
jgi:flavin-binding protein dodecin